MVIEMTLAASNASLNDKHNLQVSQDSGKIEIAAPQVFPE
jgi:hypothetical protein